MFELYRIESKSPREIKSDVLVINLFQDESQLPADLGGLDEATNGVIGGAIKDKVFSGTLFEFAEFYRPKGLHVIELLLIGSGVKHDFNYEVAFEIAGMAARHAHMKDVREIAFLLRGELSAERRGQACVEGTLMGTFDIGKYKTKNPAKRVLDSIALLPGKPGEEDELRKGAERGRLYAEATNYARGLPLLVKGIPVYPVNGRKCRSGKQAQIRLTCIYPGCIPERSNGKNGLAHPSLHHTI